MEQGWRRWLSELELEAVKGLARGRRVVLVLGRVAWEQGMVRAVDRK